MVRGKRYWSALCAILLLAPVASHAATIAIPSLSGSVEVVGMMTKNFNFNVMSSNILPQGSGSAYQFMGSDLANNGSIDVWNYNWSILADADPFIDSTFTIINLTGGTRTFNVSFGLPVSTGFSPAFKSGLLGLDFSDANGDGSASVTVNSWNGLIDGTSAMTLFAVAIPCSGTNCTGSVAPVTDGPLLHAAGVSTDIGNTLSFDLSAGDSVTVHTRFEVTPVPVPATAWLFGSALGLLGWLRRKKRSGSDQRNSLFIQEKYL